MLRRSVPTAGSAFSGAARTQKAWLDWSVASATLVRWRGHARSKGRIQPLRWIILVATVRRPGLRWINRPRRLPFLVSLRAMTFAGARSLDPDQHRSFRVVSPKTLSLQRGLIDRDGYRSGAIGQAGILMAATSAGILMYRRKDSGIEVLLVHPGGPFWRTRDLGAWSLPKGELDNGEDPEVAARREFEEELGIEVAGPLQSLGQVRQRAGKIVWGYALEDDLDVSGVRSNAVSIEWPPRSGRTITFPEIDQAAWFALSLARKKILASQRPFLERLETRLS